MSVTLKATLLGLGVMLGSLVVAGMGALALHVPVGSTAAVLTGLGMCLVAWRRPALGAPASLAAAFGLVPIVVDGAEWALGPLAQTPHIRCGTGDFAIPFLVGIGLALLFVFGWAFTVIAHTAVRMFPRTTAVLGWCIFITCAATAAAGLQALRRPPPDAFLDLFERMTLEPGGTVTFAGTTFVYEPDVKPARLLGEEHCMVVATMPDGTRRESRLEVWDKCPRLHLHHDEESGFFLLTDLEDDTTTRAVLNATREPEAIFLGDMAGRLGVPRGWAFGGVLGILVGTFALAAALATLRRTRRELAMSQQGEHTGNGWIVTPGSPPRYVADLELALPGPVVVREAPLRVPTYRDDGAARTVCVTVGTPETVRTAARVRATAWACAAVTAVLTSAVPLWVAAARGLL